MGVWHEAKGKSGRKGKREANEQALQRSILRMLIKQQRCVISPMLGI